METMPIDDIVMYRMLSFFVNGLNHNSDLISHFFKNTLLSNSSYMLVNINSILSKYGIKYMDLFSMSKICIKYVLKMLLIIITKTMTGDAVV